MTRPIILHCLLRIQIQEYYFIIAGTKLLFIILYYCIMDMGIYIYIYTRLFYFCIYYFILRYKSVQSSRMGALQSL